MDQDELIRTYQKNAAADHRLEERASSDHEATALRVANLDAGVSALSVNLGSITASRITADTISGRAP